MAILKKLILTTFISFALLATAPSAMAREETNSATLTDVVRFAGEVVDAMKADNIEYSEMLVLLKATKQASKEVIISGPADLPRTKANARIKKSRKAYRAGDKEKALKLAEEALDLYKKAKAKHFN